MRAVLTRALKGLEDTIEHCVLDYHYTDSGLAFNPSIPDCHADPVMGAKYLKELYLKACPEYLGAFSVPMLWDRKPSTIVNNESEDIARIFNTAFNDYPDLCNNTKLDLYPETLKIKIDEWNAGSAEALMSIPRAAGAALTQSDCIQRRHPGGDNLTV